MQIGRRLLPLCHWRKGERLPHPHLHKIHCKSPPLPSPLFCSSVALRNEGVNLCICGRHRRRPLSFDPEGVWEQSGLDVGTTAGFLHENAQHFLDSEAMEDAALVASYFSDVGESLFS